VTIDNRRTVVSWWIFHRQDTFSGTPEPSDIRRFIDEAEGDLPGADSILAEQYEEYTPQFCG